MARLKKWIPAERKPHVPGSAARILEYRDGKPLWEGEIIRPEDPIPEISGAE